MLKEINNIREKNSNIFTHTHTKQKPKAKDTFVHEHVHLLPPDSSSSSVELGFWSTENAMNISPLRLVCLLVLP